MRAAPEQHSLWQLALALGAQCRTDVAEGTTHLVTLSCATDKARNALRQNTKLVSPDWLIACECGCAASAAVGLHHRSVPDRCARFVR